MAHKKGLGSSKNGRDSNAKRLGVKVFAGQDVTAGSIIVRQRGTLFYPGNGASLGLSFKAKDDDHVTIRIFNIAGELVRPLLEMDARAGVLYAASWDGKNGDGDTVASGLYVVSVYGKSVHTLKKVVVIK